MLPRLKPYLDKQELLAMARRQPGAVAQFEAEFASTFEAREAIAFPYGRSALWAFFKALNIENAEVVLPAYTCVVVAHAIVLSGNIPRFVDIRLDDYNMDLEQVEVSINERTQAIIATHLFGYPLDVDHLSEIVRAAEARYGHKIWVVQDCAHAFGARWRGKLVCNAGDIALFGLNLSKMITSIFGGVVTLNDPACAARLRAWRDRHLTCPGMSKTLRRVLYLLGVYVAFNEAIYGLVEWLQEETSVLNYLTQAYHLDDKIHFPPDYMDNMLGVEARVGLAQLRKYPEIVQRRQANAHYYDEHLRGQTEWQLPPLVEGATYSHYVVRVPDRRHVLRHFRQHGVQLGQLIDYSVPHMAAYQPYAQGPTFPHSYLCSQRTINLPVYAGLSSRQLERVTKYLHVAESMYPAPGSGQAEEEAN